FGPVRPVAGLSRLSATRLTDNYLGGTSTHWRSAPLGRTQHSRVVRSEKEILFKVGGVSWAAGQIERVMLARAGGGQAVGPPAPSACFSFPTYHLPP
ncbi:MAG: hypothetical protein ABSE93_03005, partial [Terriglobia bacterium]